MKKIFIFLIGIVFLSGVACAYIAELGIDPLLVEPGSRPLGMGGAFVALDDVNSGLYNPGGLAWAKGISLSFKDAGNLSVLQAYPTGNNSSLGLAIINTKYTNIPMSGGGSATSSGTVVALSFGSKLSLIPFIYDQPFFKRLGLGLTIKGLMSQTLRRTGQNDLSGTGYEVDLGALWKGGDWWNLGISLQDMLSANGNMGAINWNDGTKEGLPARLKIGGAAYLMGDYDEPIRNDDQGLLVGLETDIKRNSSSQLRLGGEWNYQKAYFVRAGILNQNINLGLGMRMEDWGIDFSSYQDTVLSQRSLRLSVLYFPKEWIVVKKLDIAKPIIGLEDALESISLKDDIVTYDDRITVSGKVKPGVSVYINGANVSLGNDYAFNVVIPLRLKKNLIMVEARYEGEKKAWKYKVLRKAKIKVKEEEELKTKIKEAKTAIEKEKLIAEKEKVNQKKQALESLVTLGVIEVKPDQEFVMEAGITRGELAAWIVRATEIKLPLVNKNLYKDVPQDHILAPYIKAVVDAGIMQPYPDDTFRPNAFISKQEGEFVFKKLKK